MPRSDCGLLSSQTVAPRNPFHLPVYCPAWDGLLSVPVHLPFLGPRPQVPQRLAVFCCLRTFVGPLFAWNDLRPITSWHLRPGPAWRIGADASGCGAPLKSEGSSDASVIGQTAKRSPPGSLRGSGNLGSMIHCFVCMLIGSSPKTSRLFLCAGRKQGGSQNRDPCVKATKKADAATALEI